jgi:hypothetical protein
MSGLPLTSRCGSGLLFTGIREGDGWETRIVLTNTETYFTSPVIEAFDANGKLVASSRLTLSGRKTLDISTREAFDDAPIDYARIRAVTVKSNRNLMGFSMRTRAGTPTFETFSALITLD